MRLPPFHIVLEARDLPLENGTNRFMEREPLVGLHDAVGAALKEYA